MTELYMQYGTMVLMAVMTAVGWVAVRYGLTLIDSQRVKDALLRLGVELRSVVTEVNTVLVDELRKANGDGKLTAQEKELAQALAIRKLKENLGVKGLKRITKVLGIESINSWLAPHVSDAVEVVKATAPKQ